MTKILNKHNICIISFILMITLISGVIIGLNPQAHVHADEEQASAEIQMITYHEFTDSVIALYERLTGTAVPVEESKEQIVSLSVEKLYSLGLITEEEKGIFSSELTIDLQEASDVLYRIILKYDPVFEVLTAEADMILNECYDNVSIEPQNRNAVAFMMKYGIIEGKTAINPYMPMTVSETERITTALYIEFNKNMYVTVGENTVYAGENIKGVLEQFGMPNRIDVSEFGFEWYIYNADYENFVMIGVQSEKVCAFYSNAKNMKYQNIEAGTDVLKVPHVNGVTVYADIENKFDGVYYSTKISAEKVSEKVREGKQTELIDIMNAYRTKKELPILVENSGLTGQAVENSKRIIDSNIDLEIPEKVVSISGKDIFEIYNCLVSTRQYKDTLHGSKLRGSYAGVGVWYSDTGITVTMLQDTQTKIVGDRETTTTEPKLWHDIVLPKQETPVTAPVIRNPVNETIFETGTDVIVDLETATASKYLICITSIETQTCVVNAYMTGLATRFILPASLFEEGIDYTLTVSAVDAQGNMLPSQETVFCYGTAQAPVILVPQPEFKSDLASINVVWESGKYSDFQIDLYKDDKWLSATRCTGVSQTQITDLPVGTYTLSLSALRRNSNVVKAAASVKFEITAPPVQYETQIIDLPDGTQQEIQVAKPTAFYTKPQFSSNKYKTIFGDSVSVYSTKAEADANIVTVKIPVWKLKDNGEKYASTMSLQVNRIIAQEVVQIFTEIYYGSEQFPIKSVGGYSWRDTATGSKSQHSYGTCIDINPDENYCIYNSGKTIGSFWRPYENPYSITPDGDVMRAFSKYGWTWGGGWNSLKDYMHFSYLGG